MADDEVKTEVEEVKAGVEEVTKTTGAAVEVVTGMPDKITRYDRLVEDAVAEVVCDEEGIPKDMTARVMAGRAADGVPQLHIFGRNAVAVDAVADSVRSRTREVYRHYIGNRVDPEEEAATIRPMLADILKNMPSTIGTAEELIAEAKGLPLVEEAAKALNEFKEGGKTNDKEE